MYSCVTAKVPGKQSFVEINTIKKENEEVLCRGCLSTDRRLSALTDYDLYFTLLGSKQSLEEQKYPNLLLCWECLALLRRTQDFRRRLQSAQHALTNHAHNKMSTNTLSTLKYSHKQDYDYAIEESVECKPEVDIQYHIGIDIKQELELDNFETDNCNENDDDYNDEKIHEEKKVEKKAKRIYKNKYYRETKRAQKIENMIDLNDPDKYFSKVCLNETHVEEMLEKEREGDTEFRPHKCGSCGLRFPTKTEFCAHKRNNHRKRSTIGKCQQCEFTFRTQWDLQLHWWRSHPVNRCSLCGQVVIRDWERTKHLEKHKFKYRCTKCETELDNYQLYQYHDKQLHSKYICDHCARVYSTKKTLQKHIVRQHLPNKCPECPLVFDAFPRLSRHLRAAHAQAEQAYCVECDATFPNRAKYKRHLTQASRHRPPKRLSIPCPECGKIFSRKTYMNNHMRLFHSNQSRHHCALCDKYFVTGFSLRCHNKYVHEKIPMPKTKMCNVCGRGFGTNRVLENHMRTHTGERPFACARCSAAFAQRVALKAHLAAIHKEK